MKHVLLILAACVLAATVASAQGQTDDRLLSFQLTGTVTTMGNPFAGSFQVLPIYAGKGTLGQMTGNGFYVYEQIGSTGQMVVAAGQAALTIVATGDVLLLSVPPGPTGTIGPGALPGTMVWTQTWNGAVVGGTGAFAGATGTFTKSLTGFLVMPGLISPFEGTLEVHVDR